MKSFYISLLLSTVFYFVSCKKDGGSHASVPTVTTADVGDLTATGVTSGGTVVSDGGSPITARGVCWSEVTPTVADAKTTDGSGTGSFVSAVTNLKPITVYEVRAYATNSAGTGYGKPITFVTLASFTITTSPPAVVNNSGAVTGGIATADARDPITARGVCWSTVPNPTIADSKTNDGAGDGTFISDIEGLTVNVTYYVRAYATNSTGTTYGNQIVFTTAYLIGQQYEGGRIFYVDNSKLHGLIVSPADQQAAPWDNNSSGSFAYTNAYSYVDGLTNSNNIVAAIGYTGNAASLCRAYNEGGYTDWYLPSRDELNALQAQKTVIGNFQSYYYWSSTESSDYNGFAWSQDFGSGAQYDNSLKTYGYYVRPIRAF